jgi:hypothetical protein
MPNSKDQKREPPDLNSCIESIKTICAGKDFSDEEIRHRARLLFLMNRLDFWNEFPILLEEIQYQKEKANLKNK